MLEQKAYYGTHQYENIKQEEKKVEEVQKTLLKLFENKEQIKQFAASGFIRTKK